MTKKLDKDDPRIDTIVKALMELEEDLGKKDPAYDLIINLDDGNEMHYVQKTAAILTLVVDIIQKRRKQNNEDPEVRLILLSDSSPTAYKQNIEDTILYLNNQANHEAFALVGYAGYVACIKYNRV